MPLNSVQQYVKGLLDGIEVPGQEQPLVCYVTPPVLEKPSGPRAYVWGGKVTRDRQTMPRGPGFAKFSWIIDIWLISLLNPQADGVDEIFPLVVDAVTNTLATTTMPIVITDPTTGQESQIQAIGESWDLDYPPEHTPATSRMLWYACHIGMDVLEVVQQ